MVHDLSAMSEREVRATVSGGPVCVRYLYDAHGRVLLGGVPEGAQVVPASALLSKAARSRFLAAAALAATAIVFEACGGNAGGASGGSYDRTDAATPQVDPPAPRVIADPGVGDAGTDGSDASDLGDADPDASDPDAG